MSLIYPIKTNLQLGNFIKTYSGEDYYRVIGIPQMNILSEDKSGNSYSFSEDQILPINITFGVLQIAGFSHYAEDNDIYHKIFRYKIRINGSDHTLVVLEFEGKSVATFKNYTLLYIHQLQNVLKIVEPSMEISLFS